MNILTITPRIGWSLVAVFAIIISQHFGLTFEGNDLFYGSLVFAGIGNVHDELLDAINEQGEVMQKYLKKLDQLDREFLEFQKKANRPNIAGSFGGGDNSQARKDLAAYVSSRGEIKSGFTSDGPSGGWSVNRVLNNDIGLIVRNNSAVRQLISFVPIPIGGGDSYEEMVSTSALGAAWVGESQARPETSGLALAKITTMLHESYAMPVLTQRLADDNSSNLVDFLINEVSISFIEQEETALFSGNGVNEPLGLNGIVSVATADSTRAFGQIEFVKTGNSGAFLVANPLAAVKQLFYKLKSGYRKNAVWLMNSDTAYQLAALIGSTLESLWDQGNVANGTPPTLMGRPVITCESCPSIGADTQAIWFGDFNRAFRGIEREGNKVLLDPFSDKPMLRVYIYRRLGFQLRDSNALKCLKFSA